MCNIAIIPARSGSKGLKDKNIKLLSGKPLMAYTIEAALDSRCFDEIMVSTDSEKYAEIAKKYGAKVPFLRSAEQSGDKAGSWDVVKEVLYKYKKLGFEFENVMLLQPTSPLRTPQDILEAFDIMHRKKADSVVSVCEMEHSPLWSNVLSEDGCLEGFIRSDVSGANGRQELPTYYRINGAIYLTKVSDDIGNRLYDARSYAYIMDQSHSVDIDTEIDFKMAELLIENRCC